MEPLAPSSVKGEKVVPTQLFFGFSPFFQIWFCYVVSLLSVLFVSCPLCVPVGFFFSDQIGHAILTMSDETWAFVGSKRTTRSPVMNDGAGSTMGVQTAVILSPGALAMLEVQERTIAAQKLLEDEAKARVRCLFRVTSVASMRSIDSKTGRRDQSGDEVFVF